MPTQREKAPIIPVLRVIGAALSAFNISSSGTGTPSASFTVVES